jgi:hypothetical protein
MIARSMVAVVLTGVATLGVVPPANAATTRTCERIEDPTRATVRATGVSCPLARTVAGRALGRVQQGRNPFSVAVRSPTTGRRVTFTCEVDGDADIRCRRGAGKVTIDQVS